MRYGTSDRDNYDAAMAYKRRRDANERQIRFPVTRLISQLSSSEHDQNDKFVVSLVISVVPELGLVILLTSANSS